MTLKTPPPAKGKVVAITGAANFLGRKLISKLILRPNVERIIAIDIFPIQLDDPKLSFYKVDLTLPNAGSLITKIFIREGVDTLMHLVFIFSLARRSALAHELEAIGAMHLLDACAEANVKKVILRSSTMVYGAKPNNAFYMPEETPLASPNESFVSDKIEAERQLKQFADRRSDVRTVVMREGLTLGKTTGNFFLNLFKRSFVPMVMGYDPLMQFIHEDDLVDYYEQALFKDVEGTFNIVAPGVVRYSKIIELYGKKKISLPETLLKTAASVAWTLKAYDVPPEIIDYLKYPLIASGSSAEYTLGVKARYSSEDAVKAHISGI